MLKSFERIEEISGEQRFKTVICAKNILLLRLHPSLISDYTMYTCLLW